MAIYAQSLSEGVENAPSGSSGNGSSAPYFPSDSCGGNVELVMAVNTLIKEVDRLKEQNNQAYRYYRMNLGD